MSDDWTDLPIGKPARGALRLAGLVRYVDLTRVSRAEVAELHGVGPKALRILDLELESRGLRFLADSD
jgi:hypothetical protein